MRCSNRYTGNFFQNSSRNLLYDRYEIIIIGDAHASNNDEQL